MGITTRLANSPVYAESANKRTASPLPAVRGAFGKEKQLKISGGVWAAKLPQNHPALGCDGPPRMNGTQKWAGNQDLLVCKSLDPSQQRPQFLSDAPYDPWG